MDKRFWDIGGTEIKISAKIYRYLLIAFLLLNLHRELSFWKTKSNLDALVGRINLELNFSYSLEYPERQNSLAYTFTQDFDYIVQVLKSLDYADLDEEIKNQIRTIVIEYGVIKDDFEALIDNYLKGQVDLFISKEEREEFEYNLERMKDILTQVNVLSAGLNSEIGKNLLKDMLILDAMILVAVFFISVAKVMARRLE